MGFLKWIMFIILSINIYQFVLLHPVFASTNVLKPGDQFNYSSALVSSNGNFTLRFSRLFRSTNWTYLTTWDTFKNQTEWIANRDMPILEDGDGLVLKMDDSGTLKVVNRGVTLFYIFNNNQQEVGYSGNNNTRAVLEDSGNFVVYDQFNRTLWQSSVLFPVYRYRKDVLKPGDQFNSSSALVSSNGNFTLGFSEIDDSSNSTYLITFDTFKNQMVWNANPDMPILEDGDGLVLKMDNSGALKVVNRGVTLFYICNNQQEVGYSGNYTRAVLEDSGNFVVYDQFNRTLWQSSGSGGPLMKMIDWRVRSIIFILPFLVVTILLVYCCYVRIRRRRRKVNKKKRRDDIHQLIGSDSFNYGNQLEKDIKDAPNVKVFSLKAILNATNNFSNENKLGQGGYGPVYKGILSDGREIAVKRLSKTSGQGAGEFKNELILITKLQHTNLVRLYGCCVHQDEKMLVYEFMLNKSLDFFLFANDKKGKIDWHIRFNIIEGVAQGMLYLHKYSRMKVIHRDLKVSNVLLDENMTPKIADFGMARIFQHNMIEAMTNRVVGTYGYMAPEYAMEGTFSIKSDVFSFGVLILEIISGKKNSTLYDLDRTVNLVGYAWELWKGQASLELKDETLGESFDIKQLLRATHVGLLCVQKDAYDRPTMSQVISMLNNEIANLPNPKKPAFFAPRHVVDVGSPGTRSTDYMLGEILPVSVNGLTMTTMEAR